MTGMLGTSSRAWRDRPTVWPCAKPDVGDHRSEPRHVRVEVRERLGPTADLDDIKPCACKRGFQELSDEGVVFDQKQCGGCRHARAPETETAGAHDPQIVCLSGVNRPNRADDPQALAHRPLGREARGGTRTGQSDMVRREGYHSLERFVCSGVFLPKFRQDLAKRMILHWNYSYAIAL